VKAPIALFVYNRPAHSRATLEALQKNEFAGESDLLVFADGPRAGRDEPEVNEVRRYLARISGFKSIRIVPRETNLGLAASIIAGVTEVCGEYGKVIVLEDDLVTSPFFLRYMNDALDIYQNDAAVGSIHGYWYPTCSVLPETFFLRGASCWGWATWSRAWKMFEPDGRKLLAVLRTKNLASQFDLDGAISYSRMLVDQINGRNDSWAIRWHAASFIANLLQLSPRNSLVLNVGFDGTGTHSSISNAYKVELASKAIQVDRIPLLECIEARQALIHYYRSTKRTIGVRVLGKLRRIIGL
jgi:hypothetical protein